jgi:hypothetical protein
MALLISPNPVAQEEILKGFCQIMTEHSEHSRKAFRDRLKILSDTPPDLDVVIVNYSGNGGHPEFGLFWHRTSDEPDQHAQPSEKNQRPYMVGGLVFHAYNDTWGVHT